MKILIIVMLLAFSSGTHQVHNKKDTDCKKLVENMYSFLNQAGSKGKNYAMTYKVKVYFKAPGQEQTQIKESTARIMVENSNLYAESPDLILVSNKDTQVTIDKKQKRILITKTTPDALHQAKALGNLRADFLQHSREVSCHLAKNKMSRIIVLSPPADYRQKNGVEKVTFQISQKGKLQVMTFDYVPGLPIQKQEMEVLQLEENSSSGTPIQTPSETVFDRSGRIRLIYRDYTLTDTRQ